MGLSEDAKSFQTGYAGIMSLENIVAQFSTKSAVASSQKTASAIPTPRQSPAQKAGNVVSAASLHGTSIMLELRAVAVSKGNVAPFTPRGPGSAGRAPVKPSPKTEQKTVAKLVFDAIPASDGMAQGVSYHFSARQSTHQTQGGFYVDEFGTAPGTVSIDLVCLVYAVGNSGQVVSVADQIDKFKAFLDDAKLSNPLSPSYPQLLRYVNAFDGRSFILTQTTLDFRMDATRPNTLLVTVAGDILLDYSAKQNKTASADTATKTASASPKQKPVVVVLEDSLLSHTA